MPVDPVTTPQALYELLLRELAASGSTEILTADGQKLTLREAVGELYESTCSLHDLKGFPRHPSEAGPQLDHILSARAEGLFTQACVVALADAAGVDVDALYERVQKGIS